MSQKQAFKIISILFLISTITLTVRFFVVRKNPEKYDRLAKFESVQSQADEAQEQEIINNADELPINEMTVQQTTKNNRNVWSWPYDSAVPIYHNVNLDLYKNKLKDETALQNVTVYLSITAREDAMTEASDETSDATESIAATAETDLADGSADLTTESETAESAIADENQLESETELLPENSEANLQSILEGIQQSTKRNLEALGAEVILVDAKYQRDTQKAAFVGEDIIRDFVEELKEQNFQSQRLESLIPTLQAIQNASQDDATTKELFPEIGVSTDQRLLLDVERQYTNRIFINLKFGNAEGETTGSLVEYLGNQSAAIGAQSETITDTSSEKPAYIAYDTDGRQRLAQLTEKNISQLIPGLTYSGEEGWTEKVIPSLRLINLNSLEIEIGQENQTFDLQILTSEEQQKIFAEAIGNACYEFYCTDLK